MPAGFRQVILLCAALGLCPVAALLIGGDPAGPLARGAALADAERDAGLYVEPAAHAWVASRPALLTVAAIAYVVAHVAVPGWALIWTWWLRRDAFPVVRDVFLVTQALTVALYVLVPTAPPRLVDPAAFEDSLAGVWGGAAAGSAQLVQSPYAAMPSGHVAFALVAGATFAAVGDRRWLRVFGFLYPPLMVAITIATGHHLWLDAAGAAAVVGAAAAIVGLARVSRRSPARPSGGASRPSRGPASPGSPSLAAWSRATPPRRAPSRP